MLSLWLLFTLVYPSTRRAFGRAAEGGCARRVHLVHCDNSSVRGAEATIIMAHYVPEHFLHVMCQIYVIDRNSGDYTKVGEVNIHGKTLTDLRKTFRTIFPRLQGKNFDVVWKDKVLYV